MNLNIYILNVLRILHDDFYRLFYCNNYDAERWCIDIDMRYLNASRVNHIINELTTTWPTYTCMCASIA